MITSGLVMAGAWLLFSFGVYFVGRDTLGLGGEQLQTLIFVMLVLVAQINVYLIRERYHFWNSRPSQWMLLATTVDVIVVSGMALFGILMAPISVGLLFGLLVVSLLFAFLLDFVKVKTFRHYGLS
jgi:H+-transporting ATPase